MNKKIYNFYLRGSINLSSNKDKPSFKNLTISKPRRGPDKLSILRFDDNSKNRELIQINKPTGQYLILKNKSFVERINLIIKKIILSFQQIGLIFNEKGISFRRLRLIFGSIRLSVVIFISKSSGLIVACIVAVFVIFTGVSVPVGLRFRSPKDPIGVHCQARAASIADDIEFPGISISRVSTRDFALVSAGYLLRHLTTTNTTTTEVNSHPIDTSADTVTDAVGIPENVRHELDETLEVREIRQEREQERTLIDRSVEPRILGFSRWEVATSSVNGRLQALIWNLEDEMGVIFNQMTACSGNIETAYSSGLNPYNHLRDLVRWVGLYLEIRETRRLITVFSRDRSSLFRSLSRFWANNDTITMAQYREQLFVVLYHSLMSSVLAAGALYFQLVRAYRTHAEVFVGDPRDRVVIMIHNFADVLSTRWAPEDRNLHHRMGDHAHVILADTSADLRAMGEVFAQMQTDLANMRDVPLLPPRVRQEPAEQIPLRRVELQLSWAYAFVITFFMNEYDNPNLFIDYNMVQEALADLHIP